LRKNKEFKNSKSNKRNLNNRPKKLKKSKLDRKKEQLKTKTVLAESLAEQKEIEMKSKNLA